jgi:hypothetical protein
VLRTDQSLHDSVEHIPGKSPSQALVQSYSCTPVYQLNAMTRPHNSSCQYILHSIQGDILCTGYLLDSFEGHRWSILRTVNVPSRLGCVSSIPIRQLNNDEHVVSQRQWCSPFTDFGSAYDTSSSLRFSVNLFRAWHGNRIIAVIASDISRLT